eukprot:XP_011664193.1 PREDICTED: uncharacterized protein LOC582848 isoform X1 [Strongylocentrotus purpuratus]
MATGGVELPQIRPLGRPLKRANSINAGLGDSTKLVDINLSSSLMKRLPATISSTLGHGDEVVNEGSSTRRRFSLQPPVKNKTTEKRQEFYKRLSSRNLMGAQSGAKSRTSDIPSNLSNGKISEKEERGRRQLTRSESFRLGAIKELVKQNSSLSDIYDDSAYLRRVSNFSDGAVDVVKTRAVPRTRGSSLTRQISLLSLRSKGSTMSLMSLDTGEVRGRAERRKSRGSFAPSLRTRKGGRQGESPSRIGGRLSRRSQLKAIAPPPSVLKHRFMKAVRLLQLINRSFQINKSSRYVKEQDSECLGLGGPPSPRKGARIFFDLSHFKARKEGQLSCETKRILSKESSERTPEEVQKALVSLRNTLDAFCEFPVQMQQSIAKFGFYNKLEKRRIIIREGYRAENFHLMLSGTAVVTTTTRDGETQEARVRLVNFIRRGNTFGERELMTGVVRPHTIVCHEEVELLSLDKEEYVTIFIPKNEQEIVQDVGIASFLQTIKVFHDWPVEKLPKNNPAICLLTYFRKGAVVCLDSNKTEWIFVIKTGACQVLKELKEPTTSTPRKKKGKESPKKKYTSRKTNQRKKPMLPPIIKVTEDHAPSSSSWLSSPTPSIRDDVSIGSMMSDDETKKPKGGRFYNAAKTVFSTEVRLKQKLDCIGDAEEHISLLDNLTARSRSPRLADLTTTLMASVCSDAGSVRSGDERNSIFLKLRRCVTGEVFGLNSVLFKSVGGSPSLTLTSEGAECILISKNFFLQHLTETAKDRLLRTVPPWPAEARLQELVQEHADWDRYKSAMMGDIVTFKQNVAAGTI